MDKPFLCTVDNSYLMFLQKADARVPQKPTRPFVAIAIDINGYKYAVPLTSIVYRSNGERRNPRYTLEIPDGHGRPIAAILFNNMIPVSSNNIKKTDIALEPSNAFLCDESRFINTNEDKINQKAMTVYTLRKNGRDSFCNGFSCDFTNLEKCCDVFQRSQTQHNIDEKGKGPPSR